MHVTILHNAVAEDARPDERDVLVQVDLVSAALKNLGHQVSILSCDLDLQALREDLARLRPAVVFNLVESLGGADRLAQIVPALLAELGVPFTGASAESLVLTNHKLLAKRQMLAAGLPTPTWVSLSDELPLSNVDSMADAYIIKAVGEHASLGIDDESVVCGLDRAALVARLREHSARLGRPCFAEAFIPGREFNLSVLAAESSRHTPCSVTGNGTRSVPVTVRDPLVLPPAEIDFSTFPSDKPRIVGYRAKWDETAPEFSGTPRTFDFVPADRALLDELVVLATTTWRLFLLRGYARVDFRVDEQGRPWILEVNANPCLSPDAGFYAALTRAALSFDEAVERILQDAG